MIVYCATNLVSGKKYVGVTTKTLCLRIQQHFRSKKRTPFNCALRAYGTNGFKIEQIDTAQSREELFQKEMKWIRELKTQHPNGYNLTQGGDGIVNPSPEIRAKNAAEHRGKRASLETRRKMSVTRRGRKMPVGFADQVRRWMTGRIVSEETKQKISEVQRGKKRGPYSPERCAAVSAGCMGRKVSPEVRARISKTLRGNIPWNKGKTLSAAHCQNLSRAHMGKKRSVESKRRQAASMAAIWEKRKPSTP
jgi:group I intron endonuclease